MIIRSLFRDLFFLSGAKPPPPGIAGAIVALIERTGRNPGFLDRNALPFCFGGFVLRVQNIHGDGTRQIFDGLPSQSGEGEPACE
ncbi:hypothetical protein AV540_18390 [Brevibacillus parabrevis]|nr:hypothetical protein AV540_18390 [Brevibacillus parabrevis]